MKKFKYIIVLFVMGLISFSCTDLDEEIFSEITTDNYYQNSNNIYAALVNNYAKAFSTVGVIFSFMMRILNVLMEILVWISPLCVRELLLL